MSGFSLLGSQVWDVSETDRTVWVKFCDTMKTKTYTNNLNTDDPIGTASTYTGALVIASIVNDFNNVNSSFLRLAAYPDDPANPGAAATGDSTFTIAKASTRTINVCYGSLGGSRGGEAKQTISGSKITGCTVSLSSSLSSDLKQLIGTTTHEIGHCVGLDHPMETTNAIMSYFRSTKRNRLMSDDKMGIVFQYPKAAVNAKEANTFGLSCAKQ